MKKTTITVSFDDEKLSALKMYLAQKNTSAETELEKSLENLYTKAVPVGVREFIGMKSGNGTKSPPTARKSKNSLSSAVGAKPFSDGDSV